MSASPSSGGSALVTAIVLGGGQRGNAYARYALTHPDDLKIVAVAEPDTGRRAAFARLYDLPDSACYENWQDALNAGKVADAAINTTMDRIHYPSTRAALAAGYDVLLEKPMSPIIAENVQLVQAAEQAGRLLQVCHVLRYTSFFNTLRDVIRSGVLGQIISLDHRENLAYWHMAHSFVRGNWRNAEESSPMILTKCCHDFDILLWLLEAQVTHLNSFGSLTHFTRANAPHPDIPARCTDGCIAAETCKYEAQKIYGVDGDDWPANILTPTPTRAARLKALENSPYSRCVYRSDNNVVDHQTVNMLFENGITATLMMNGHGHEEGRSLRIDGTKATLTGKFSEPYKLNIYHHASGNQEAVPIPSLSAIDGGHGGGDTGIVRSFINAMRGIHDDRLSTARVSLESHLLAFAAEEARLTRGVIEMAAFRHHSETAASLDGV